MMMMMMIYTSRNITIYLINGFLLIALIISSLLKLSIFVRLNSQSSISEIGGLQGEVVELPVLP